MRERNASVSTRVLDGYSPGAAIVQYAQSHAADAIAMSTTGAGPVRRLLPGSVTDRVVRSSEVPVLVCHVRRLQPSFELEQDTALLDVNEPTPDERARHS